MIDRYRAMAVMMER